MSDALVLCYHAVSEDWPADLAVTPDRLHAQLELLVRRGYSGSTFAELVESRWSARGSRERLLAVTFDDAYRSVLELARPILADLGLPGTVFVPTAFAGTGTPMAWPGIDHWRGGPHEAELVGMSWDELGTLADSGWEIGSHTRSHPRLTRLDEAELGDELRRSRAECEERLGRPCHTLAYPYGDVDARVALAAGEAGYRAAGTLPARFDRPSPLRWPRVGVYRGDDRWRYLAKISTAIRKVRASAAWAAVERAPYRR